ncbi:MAG: DUF11 domain-containing protein, partial [Bacteroidetes Order II. Incertae sedis bacterium]|nr:DUF11 domain-containing protein [Bacteroidetes Order II. bacterium]
MDLPYAGPYDPAAMVTIRYRYSCSSLTTGCGALTIITPVPTTLQFVSMATPTGTTGSYDAGTRNLTINRNPYNDGNSGDVLVTFRIDPSAAGQTINIPGTSVITDPIDPANGTLNASVNLTVSSTPPSPKYTMSKIKGSPTGNPATGTDVTYIIEFWATTINGNVDVAPVTLTDTFPAGATVVNADGGTVSGNTITWTLPSTNLVQTWINAGIPGAGGFRIAQRIIVLNYPSGTFGSSNVTNEACADGSSPYGNLHECASATHGFSAATPAITFQKFYPSYDAPIPSEGGSDYFWRLRFHTNDSNTPLQNLVITETVPAGLQFSKVYSGRWQPTTSIQARVEYSTDNGGSWTPLGTQDGSPSGAREFIGGIDYPNAGVTNFRWVFLNDIPIATETVYGACFLCESQRGPGFYFTIPSGSAGTTIQNCASANFTGLATPQQSCHDLTIPAAIPRMGSNKILATSGSLKPGDEVEFNVYAGNSEGTAPFPDPILSDLLPPELEFVRWVSFTSTDPTAPSPNLEVLNNYNGTGRTLVRWVYGNTVPAGSFRVDGTPGVANSYAMPPLQGTYGGFYIKFVAKIKAGTPVGNYANRLFVSSRAYNNDLACAGNFYGSITVQEADVNDLDGDGNTTELICRSYGASFSVVAAVVMGAEKWIKGHASLPNVDDPASTPAIPDAFCPTLDGAYTRFPCIARTVPGGTFDYKIKLINYGNLALKDYVAYDVFPFVGDTGVSEILAPQTRLTQWAPLMVGPPTAADAYTTSVLTLPGAEIAYTFSTNPCRPEMSNSTNESGWQGACTNDWTTTVTNWSAVKGFRLKVPFTNAPHWEAGKEIILNVPMQVPVTAPFEAVAWNSIAHRSTNAGLDPTVTTTRLDTAEPRKVGIAIPTGAMIPGYRLGNLVWMDTNQDGMADSGEMGIEGVLVELYNSANTLITSTNTDVNGKYLFTALTAGDYYVKIPSNQASALNPAALTGKTSSTVGEEADPDSDGDNNDNGTIVDGTGVRSGIVTLGEGTGLAEPTNELDRKGSATDDDNDAFADNRSNLSVDFGFIAAATCSINTPTVTPTCSNNGTPSDPADDTFTFTISTTGSNTGATYKVDKIAPAPTSTVFASVNYGVTSASSAAFPISGGNLTLTLTDNTTATCTNTPVTVTAPPTCSGVVPTADLELTKTSSSPVVRPGDTLTFTLTLVNKGPGTANGVVVRDMLP